MANKNRLNEISRILMMMVLNNDFKSWHRANILELETSQFHEPSVFKWYLFYRPCKDERKVDHGRLWTQNTKTEEILLSILPSMLIIQPARYLYVD